MLKWWRVMAIKWTCVPVILLKRKKGRECVIVLDSQWVLKLFLELGCNKLSESGNENEEMTHLVIIKPP